MWRFAFAGALLVACATESATPSGDGSIEEVILDHRIERPDDDAAFLDFVTPDAVVRPGEERMFCLHVEHAGAEIAIDRIVGVQGPGGHHVSLMTTLEPKPHGTFEECTTPEANAGLRWFVLTTGALPPGSAMSIPQGQHLVIQFHYLNAGDFPVRVDAGVRLHLVDLASVTTWVATMVSSDVAIEVTPGTSATTYDCILRSDRTMLSLFGHMHEHGTRISIDVGPSLDALENRYTIDWQPAFRDDPPWVDFAPALELPAGTLIRTSCEWSNATSETVRYPSEMCFAFAYLGGAKSAAICEP